MYVSPKGRWFAHAAAAVIDLFETDEAIARYYADWAPLTCKWLRHLQSSGDVHRNTRFDDFLHQILARGGYKRAA